MLSCLVLSFLQYIPDVSRSVFGLLTAMQKRARDSEEGDVGGAGAGSKGKSKKAKVAGSGSVGGSAFSASPKVLFPCILLLARHNYVKLLKPLESA